MKFKNREIKLDANLDEKSIKKRKIILKDNYLLGTMCGGIQICLGLSL
jgi:hypothetical protein